MRAKDPIQGNLQEQIMRVMWRLDRGSVEQVRKALPKPSRRAYTTIQTVLNRLAERGLLGRQREGNVIFYSALVSEADYISGSLNRTLSGASHEARRAALANLVGDLDPSELVEVRELADQIDRERRG
ncbi:MAG: BlaI/MecI/CopY family transcriptional regulator [bacterium]